MAPRDGGRHFLYWDCIRFSAPHSRVERAEHDGGRRGDGRFLFPGAVAICAVRAGDPERGSRFRRDSGGFAAAYAAVRPRILFLHLPAGDSPGYCFQNPPLAGAEAFPEILPACAVGAVWGAGIAGRLLRDGVGRSVSELAGPLQHFRAHHVCAGMAGRHLEQ